ncbi:Archaemetzincin-2 [Dissostichus eleginoides]|uniref:Archaemetzincin-2 n=1 Tax=Dissostichus eleginoides TaxID=100907 RepID=A0AAD9BEZ1_DISEL|nr:Archaemetzincin-2 [Dissostichus eleginoides]
MMCVSSDLSLLPQVLSAYASVVEQTAKANQLTTMNSRLRPTPTTFRSSPVTCYSSCGVGNQAFCIVGITMINLYPKDSWNFVFGQASLSNVHWMEVDQTPEESSTCQSLLHFPKPTEAFQTSRLWLHTCLDILRE